MTMSKNVYLHTILPAVPIKMQGGVTMLCIPVIAAAAAGTLLFGQHSCCEFEVGGVNFNDQCWLDNPLCVPKKQLCYEQCMSDKGRKCWRTKPELVAANFLNNEFICQEFRSESVTVCDTKECGDNAYVVLSFPNCDKMAFELTRPVKKGCGGIWAVRKYAYV